jgi:NAD dependent epimerase/dehydratase family enzyme
MKIVIAGSRGLVGTALTDSLLRDGHTVVRLLRSGSGAKKESASGDGRQKENGRSAQKGDS